MESKQTDRGRREDLGRWLMDIRRLPPVRSQKIERVRLALQKLHGDRLPDLLPECLQPVAISVDLFKPSTEPKYGRAALELHEQGLGPTAIGKRLGISKRCACIARDFGRQLRQAGVDDPFIELTKPPTFACRWGSRPRRSGPQSDR